MKKRGVRVLICGAGSIGIYLGAKLHRAGYEVEMFGRRKLSSVENQVEINNKSYLLPKKLFRLTKNTRYNLIFITTKLYDFKKMILLLKKYKLQGNFIAAIQNGIVDLSSYEQILHKKIMSLVVFSGFNLKNNKIHVSPTKIGWKTPYTKQGLKISRLLKVAGIPCSADKKFDMLRAEKTIVNCCLNALSAIERVPFTKLFKNKKTRKRIDNLFYECHQILSKNYPLDAPKIVRSRLINHWHNVNHYSSTYQDLVSGRKNEVPYFNGYLVILGKKHNIPAEQNQLILKEINSLA